MANIIHAEERFAKRLKGFKSWQGNLVLPEGINILDIKYDEESGLIFTLTNKGPYIPDLLGNFIKV